MDPQFTDLKALDIWRRALVSSVRLEAPDLSARQMALLLSVYRRRHTRCAGWSSP